MPMQMKTMIHVNNQSEYVFNARGMQLEDASYEMFPSGRFFPQSFPQEKQYIFPSAVL